jgi:hypothetical protein
MKLLFSEARPDYGHYIFPYAVWAFPGAGETPADLFAAGFLPSTRQLDRFYLCRHVRVPLGGFAPSSENRRILRKGEGLAVALVPRAEFVLTEARREFCRRFTHEKFGEAGRSAEWVTTLFTTPATTHVLHCTDAATGADAGIATLYLEAGRMGQYSYAFYDLAHPNRSLGMFLMTKAVELLAAQGYGHLYTGTCYTESALYKTQLPGCEFFNGHRWSDNLAELKFILARQQQPALTAHLLEDAGYREHYAPAAPADLAARSPFLGGPPPA